MIMHNLQSKAKVSINKLVLEDTRLSWHTKGLFCYLMTIPEDEISLEKIVIENQVGETRTYTCLNELIKFGYLERKNIRKPDGKMESVKYILNKDYSPTTHIPDKVIIESDYCAVYLMVDIYTEYYKIGISADPKTRLTSLRKEFPSIYPVSWVFLPTGNKALKIEQALHQTFEAFNIKGEWFDLEGDDVAWIKNYFHRTLQAEIKNNIQCYDKLNQSPIHVA